MATTGAPAGGVGATPSTVSKITFKSGTAAVPTANLDDPDSVVMTANHVLAQGLGHTGWVSVVGGNATCAATLNSWILGDTFDGKPDLLSDRANWIPTGRCDAVRSNASPWHTRYTRGEAFFLLFITKDSGSQKVQ